MTLNPISNWIRNNEGRRYLHDAALQIDLPSINEVLTIRQCGFPRTYNLNDGMDWNEQSVQSPEGG